jgi:tol-pal system protein YbgF
MLPVFGSISADHRHIQGHMTRSLHRLRSAALVALALSFAAGAALAQDRSGNFLDNIFNRGDEQSQQQAPSGGGSGGGNDIGMRLDRIENTMRQLTGNIEQLQYQNQQLQSQVRELQQRAGIAGPSTQGGPGSLMPSSGMRRNAPPIGAPANAAPPGPMQQPMNAAPSPDRRGDAFNPNSNPNAPGVPRTLGSETVSDGRVVSAGPGVGAPGGREAGTPLDLSSMGGNQARPGAAPPMGGNLSSQLPPPPQSNPSATGNQQLATLPPSHQPKDEYQLAYGYMLHKDYGLAAQAFRDFVRKYPNEKLVSDAQYWLGESQFQQQKYRDAAEAFLAVSTKYKSSPKAPESLLRLGQSLAALHKKEAACATLAEVGRKYPHAAAGVKRQVAQEQKRVHC